MKCSGHGILSTKQTRSTPLLASCHSCTRTCSVILIFASYHIKFESYGCTCMHPLNSHHNVVFYSPIRTSLKYTSCTIHRHTYIVQICGKLSMILQCGGECDWWTGLISQCSPAPFYIQKIKSFNKPQTKASQILGTYTAAPVLLCGKESLSKKITSPRKAYSYTGKVFATMKGLNQHGNTI